MSTMEINGLLGILRNPHFVDGIVVGSVSKRFHLSFLHSSADHTLHMAGR